MGELVNPVLPVLRGAHDAMFIAADKIWSAFEKGA
jgi:hypothetical protein